MIKNIIFDLGGVIINVDYQLTIEALRQVGAYNIDQCYAQAGQIDIFSLYETGKISSEQFRKETKALLNIAHIDDCAFTNAWNAMLLDLPFHRLDFIRSLKDQGYRTFLFSNTNEIHIEQFYKILSSQALDATLSDYFEQEYYSHTLGLRKPEVQAFQTIIREQHLNPDETLFVDDTFQHIEGAKKAGLHARLIDQDNDIFSIPRFIEEIERQ